jgi:hypothetical protein
MTDYNGLSIRNKKGVETKMKTIIFLYEDIIFLCVFHV